MNWKDLPYWLKGGIIGLVFGIIIGTFYLFSSETIFAQIAFFFVFPFVILVVPLYDKHIIDFLVTMEYSVVQYL